jgi:hypothetical protein
MNMGSGRRREERGGSALQIVYGQTDPFMCRASFAPVDWAKALIWCGFQRIAATCYDLIPARLPI